MAVMLMVTCWWFRQDFLAAERAAEATGVQVMAKDSPTMKRYTLSVTIDRIDQAAGNLKLANLNRAVDAFNLVLKCQVFEHESKVPASRSTYKL